MRYDGAVARKNFFENGLLVRRSPAESQASGCKPRTGRIQSGLRARGAEAGVHCVYELSPALGCLYVIGRAGQTDAHDAATFVADDSRGTGLPTVDAKKISIHIGSTHLLDVIKPVRLPLSNQGHPPDFAV